jgi:hypothetical protein
MVSRHGTGSPDNGFVKNRLQAGKYTAFIMVSVTMITFDIILTADPDPGSPVVQIRTEVLVFPTNIGH